MAEALASVSSQDAAFVNPKACQADVSAETIFDEGILGASVALNCRKCDLSLGFDMVGIESKVLKDMRTKISAICPELSGQEVAPDLLPQIKFL